MKLLRDLRLLVETFSAHDISIDDIQINYNNIQTSNGKYDFECPGVIVTATVSDTDYGLVAMATVYFNAHKEDNSFDYTFNDEYGTHDPGADYDVSDLYVELYGINSDNKEEIVKLFGNMNNLSQELHRKIVEEFPGHIDLQKLERKFSNY